MPLRSQLYGRLDPQSYPTTPPITLHQIDELEKLLIRKELSEALVNKIENVAAIRGVRDRCHGDAHLWSKWRILLGVTHWPDVGRLYRKCIVIGHVRRHRECVTRPRFMTTCLLREQRVELEEMRALYDALGPQKWSLTSNPGGPAEAKRARWIRFLWREREHPTLETLGAVFWRLLDEPTDEEMQSNGWDADSDGGSASWIVAEPDSDSDLNSYLEAHAEREDGKE
ncbi:hypothetical protein V5O48_014763 [Marasmius crinis-equi]|uniref:Uncharacterized protein n=1 Tax=Marasmius crinis-equi TaxID=585013 RepID=A0ABR3EWD5_9AGAR